MYTEIRFTLNGEQKLYQGDPLRRLLDVLREDYGLTGSKEGCGEGECGACSIIKNGELVTSCIIPVGACTTSAEIARSPIAPELLKDAASRMGAIALRNSATIGGNIGNASPKGDMPQPLILMDAEVVLTSVDGERRMLVDDYIIATKKTALREDEIITKVIIPKQDFTHTFFRKIGMRRANAISKLTLSAAATVRDGVLVDFRASSGAAGPKVARSRKAEELLIGKKVSELHTCKEEFLDAWNTVISPHAMPEYRRNTTRRMLAFFIDALEAGHAPGRVDIQE